MKKRVKEEGFLIFSVSGGIGKNIAGTAIVRELKKKYPERKVIVLTAHMDVWLFNPNVYRVYTFDKALYFYDQYIKGQDTLIFAQDPYMHQNYINKSSHLIRVWADICGLEAGIDTKPEIFLNQRELEYAKNNYASGASYIVMQSHGGASQDVKHSWYRDIPFADAQAIVTKLVNNGKRVIHVRRQDQPQLQGVDVFSGSVRQAWALLLFSSGAILMDSMMQHAAAALGKDATVLWIGNHPKQLGYPTHNNVMASINVDDHQNPFGLLSSHSIIGTMEECPIPPSMSSLFDVSEVVSPFIGK